MRPGRKWNKTAALELAGLPYRTRTTLAHSSRCPVTRGQPTRLTDPTWRRMCQALRDPGNLACSQCHEGDNPPAELTIVTADQLTITTNKENDMSMYGECEICGEKKKIRSVRNKNACATCEHIWRAANVQPDLVLRTLIDVKGNEYVAGAAGVEPPVTDAGLAGELMAQILEKYGLDDPTALPDFIKNLHSESNLLTFFKSELSLKEGEDVIDRIQELKDAANNAARRAHAAEQAIATIRDQLDLDGDESILEAVAGLRREWQHAVKLCTETLAMLGADAGTNLNNLPQLAAELFASNDRRRHHISDLEAIVDGDQIQPTNGEIVLYTRTATLLDLALDVIAGRVSGLDAERIAALR